MSEKYAMMRLNNGAVAQVGERLNGIQEAGGSSPPSSTISEEETQVSDEMTEDSLI